jgi:hypothetical protein
MKTRCTSPPPIAGRSTVTGVDRSNTQTQAISLLSIWQGSTREANGDTPLVVDKGALARTAYQLNDHLKVLGILSFFLAIYMTDVTTVCSADFLYVRLTIDPRNLPENNNNFSESESEISDLHVNCLH